MMRTVCLILCMLFGRVVAEEPTLLMGVVVKNYDQLLPAFLKSVERLSCDKSKIDLQFDVCSNSPTVINILSDWKRIHQSTYNTIEIVKHPPVSDKNKLYAEIQESYLSKTVELNDNYCFILASDVFLAPQTLEALLAHPGPIISPMLRPAPIPGDMTRNFFADVTEFGYYRDHPDYEPIANRQKRGTFKVPCVYKVYLIQASACPQLSFLKNRREWEFLGFSTHARENQIDQYLCNEQEFGEFVHFFETPSDEEQMRFSLVGAGQVVTRDLIDSLLAPFSEKDSYLKTYATRFSRDIYTLSRVQNRDLFYIDDVYDTIKSFYLRNGYPWEEFIHEQFSRFVKPGSVALDIGGHIGIHTVNLSRLVGESGSVHVFEPQAKMFCELVINTYLNQCRNVVAHHNALGASHKWIEMTPDRAATAHINEGGSRVADITPNEEGDRSEMITLDSLHLENISLIKIDVEGAEMGVIEGGKETIKKWKPVMIIEFLPSDDRDQRIQQVEQLGYTHAPLPDSNYLFIPTVSRVSP